MNELSIHSPRATRRASWDADRLAAPATHADPILPSWTTYEPVKPTVIPAGTRATLVMVVDDDADYRELCARHLAMLGCRVLAGGDADDAVRLAQLTQPDLILMDLIMPVTDGIQATHRLRGDARTRALRIAGMTNYGARWQAMARTAGCDAVFEKTDLIQRFEQVARSLLPNLPSGSGSNPPPSP